MCREREVIRLITSGIVHKVLYQGIVSELQRSIIMTNKARLYARRREMYRLHVQKMNTTEILDKLSAKYNISKQALWQDWQKRTCWVYDVFDLEPARAQM